MDVRDSLALFELGRERWNAWAASMIERRRRIVAAGDWAWARDSRADVYPTNRATADWMRDAAAQFNDHEFAERPDFSGFAFPGAALFVATKFPRGARFRAARFLDGACFNFARFGAAAEFHEAEFRSQADFCRTEFRGEARFDESRFEPAEFEPGADGRLDCSNAKFSGAASFAGMACAAAVFAETEFAAAANFERARFDEMFFLWSTVFLGEVRTQGAKFPYAIDWPVAPRSGSATG